MSTEELDIKSKTLEESKIDELNKAEASTFVHLFTRACAILGYSVFLCLASSIVMKGLSLINYSDSVYNNGLPKVIYFIISSWYDKIHLFYFRLTCGKQPFFLFVLGFGV